MISTDDKRLKVVDCEMTEIYDVLWIRPIYAEEFKELIDCEREKRK